jgi:hypothetical protein
MWHTNLKDPACPEHGEPMMYEPQPNWWRGKCGCQIRVFDESGAAHVPATSIRWVPALHGHRIPRPGLIIWRPLETA